MAAGADAADQMDAAFRAIIDNDPEIQAVIKSVWGNASRDQRPSDTPKNLESANDRASKQIAQILQRKGITLPDRTFINPRSGTIEGHRGWAGLNGIQKAAIIAAAAAATGGAFGAAGAFGGAGGGAGAGGGGAAASGAASATPGVTAGLGGLSLTGSSLVTPWAGAVAPSMIASTMAPTLSASTLAGSVAPTAGGGLMTGLRNALKNPGNVAETVGTVAHGIGTRAQQERQSGLDYGLLRDRLGIDNSQTNESNQVNRADLELRQNQDQRTDLNNAFDRNLQAELIKGWPGAPSMPSRIPTFNLGPTAPTQGARDTAGSMAGQTRSIVDQGGRRGTALPDYVPYQLNSPTERPGASTTEKLADIIGLGGNALSGLLNPPNQQNQVNNLEQWLQIFGRGRQ